MLSVEDNLIIALHASHSTHCACDGWVRAGGVSIANIMRDIFFGLLTGIIAAVLVRSSQHVVVDYVITLISAVVITGAISIVVAASIASVGDIASSVQRRRRRRHRASYP